MPINLNNIAILNICILICIYFKHSVDYCCNIRRISKSDAVNLL